MKTKYIIYTLAISILFFCNTGLSMAETYEADYTPWSGYWWPTQKGGLVTGSGYNGSPSPLEKYDLAVHGVIAGPATNFARERYHDPYSLSWEGLCFEWAVASMSESEPVHRGIYEGTVFNVGDKKALLTAVYHGTLFNRITFYTPVDFHKVLEDNIRDQKIPVVMNLGSPGGAVWNYPVFKYDTEYTESGNTRHYKTIIYFASDDVDPDYVGTLVVSESVEYAFTMDNDGNIVSSEWEGLSVLNPPVNASEPYGLEPVNPGLDYDKVVRIAKTDDDPFENIENEDNPAPLVGGTYEMLAIDSDWFSVEMEAGDTLDIRMESENGNPVSMKVSDPWRSIVEETDNGTDSLISVTATAAGSYYIEIEPLEPESEPLYSLSLMQSLSFSGIFPANSIDSEGTGFTLLNPDNEMGRIIATQIDKDGIPIQSAVRYRSEFQTLGMIHQEFDFSDFDSDGYVRVDSDNRLVGLETLADTKFQLSGLRFASSDLASEELFYPCFSEIYFDVAFFLINSGNETEEISLSFYDSEGNEDSSETVVLNPGEKIDYATFGVKRTSMSAEVLSGRKCLHGYIEFSDSWALSRQKATVPVIPEKHSRLIIPHAASNDEWYTEISVVNVGNTDTTASFIAYGDSGEVVGEVVHDLKARRTFTNRVGDLFEGIPGESVAAIRIISDDQPLNGYMLYGRHNGLNLAGIPLSEAKSSRIFLPHVASSDQWATGVGIFNSGDISDDVLFALKGANGNTIRETVYPLEPNQRIAISARDLFGDDIPGLSYIEFESQGDQPLIGTYVMLTMDNDRWLFGGIIQ